MAEISNDKVHPCHLYQFPKMRSSPDHPTTKVIDDNQSSKIKNAEDSSKSQCIKQLFWHRHWISIRLGLAVDWTIITTHPFFHPVVKDIFFEGITVAQAYSPLESSINSAANNS
jgi:hypothetical protein